MRTVFLVFILVGFWILLPTIQANISLPLFISCQNAISAQSQFSKLDAAVLCGADLYDSKFYSDFIDLGLIHLFVVSGFHLLLIVAVIERFWPAKFNCKKIFILSVAFLYCLICRLNPPVTRVAVLISLQFLLSGRHKIYCSSLLQFFCGVCCLLLFPSWWQSTSFLLSWAAGLLMSLPIKSHLCKHALMYIFMSFFLINFSFAHPISILLNFLLVPLFSFVLFPTSLLFLIVPQSLILHDFIWSTFLQLCHRLASDFQATAPLTNFSLLIFWSVLFVLHFFFWRFEVGLLKKSFSA